MTPQMKKVLQKSQHLIDGIECDLPVGIVDMTDIIQRACVEYAKSIIQTPVQVILIIKDPIMQERWDGVIKKIVDSFEEQIQQDSLDLPTNS